MGDYTRIKRRATLRVDTPTDVLLVLRETFRLQDEWIEMKPVPAHAFFRAPRWECVFSGISTYFDTEPDVCELMEGELKILRFHSSLKNYDGEIEKFCDWIGRYVADPAGTVVSEEEFMSTLTKLIIDGAGRIVEVLPAHEVSSEAVGGEFR